MRQFHHQMGRRSVPCHLLTNPCFGPDWPFQAWRSKSPFAGSLGCSTAGWSSLRPRQRPWRPHRALVRWSTAPQNQGGAVSGRSCKATEEAAAWADGSNLKDWVMGAERWSDQGLTFMTAWHSPRCQLPIRSTGGFPLEVPLGAGLVPLQETLGSWRWIVHDRMECLYTVCLKLSLRRFLSTMFSSNRPELNCSFIFWFASKPQQTTNKQTQNPTTIIPSLFDTWSHDKYGSMEVISKQKYLLWHKEKERCVSLWLPWAHGSWVYNNHFQNYHVTVPYFCGRVFFVAPPRCHHLGFCKVSHKPR